MPCPHHRPRSWDCVDCYVQGSGGGGICHHLRRAARCSACRAAGGTPREMCVHDRQRHQCHECLPLNTSLSKNAFCSICGVKRLSKIRRGAQGICATCDKVEPRAEQKFMSAILQHVDHQPSGIDNLSLGGIACGTRHRRPDAIWIAADHAVIVELDEDSHRARQPSCELAKIIDQSMALKELMKRTNYRVDTLRVGDLNVAHAPAVAAVINRWIKYPEATGSDILPNIGFMLYNSGGDKHIKYAMEHANVHVGILYP